MRYNTMREAAVAGLAIAIPKSFKEKVEYGGVIRKDDGGYWPDGTHTDNDPSSVTITDPMEYIFNSGIVAVFHTHVITRDNLWTNWFSGQDVKVAYIAGKPHFLGDADTGDVYEMHDPEFAFNNIVLKVAYGRAFPAFQGEKVARVAREAA